MGEGLKGAIDKRRTRLKLVGVPVFDAWLGSVVLSKPNLLSGPRPHRKQGVCFFKASQIAMIVFSERCVRFA
jgi:hypothetical protein